MTVSDGTASTTQNITVNINNINDAPVITSSANWYDLAEGTTTVGTIVIEDQDGDSNFSFSLSGTDSEYFEISSVGVFAFKVPADFETKSVYRFTITVSDDNGGTTTQEILVAVLDEDLWTKSSFIIDQPNANREGCGTSMGMSKNGNVFVCGMAAGGGSTSIYSYSSGSNGTWNIWDNSNGPFPGALSTQGNYGQVISLSDDGNVLAISAPVGDGSVWAFSRNGNSWTHKNNTSFNGGSLNNPGMVGPSGQSDYFGSSLSLDSDGNRIAVGTQFGNNNAGFIRVYEWTYLPAVDRSQWNQIGDDMVGSNFSPGAGLGTSVALSNDGNTLIGGASDRNYVNIYSYDGSSWTLDATFSGDSSSCFGGDVDIDSDGDTVVVSANGCDGENDRGYVNVYRKNSSNNTWSQLGNSILGEYDVDDISRGFGADEFGHEVSMSDNGNIVAISSRKNPGSLDVSSQYKSAGHVRVFEYKNGDWDQLENDIDGDLEDGRFGDSISLTNDGKKLTVLSSEDTKVYTFTRD